MLRVGINIKVAGQAAVYRKALRLSGAARAEAGVGQITQLMANDTRALQDIFQHMMPLIISVPMLIAGFWLLYREVGNGLFAGLGFIVLITPGNIALFSRIARLFKLAQAASDARVKLITEVLMGIRVIKRAACRCRCLLTWHMHRQ